MSIQNDFLIGTRPEDKKRNQSKEAEQCKELSELTMSQTPSHIHLGGQSSTEESQRSAVHFAEEPALLVFSHLRWHFVTQRPQHLLTRAAQSRHVYFWEEPWFHDAADPESRGCDGGSLEFLQAEQTPDVTVIRPHFTHGEDPVEGQRRLLDRFLSDRCLERFDSWFYTPMALSFTAHLHPRVTVYDCMDELSAFLGAPPELIEREKELFRVADVIFTGGQSIYEAKRSEHSNVHAFPSSIEVPHFAQARAVQSDPSDQAGIPNPRVGFFGVLDERFDSALVSEVARLRPHVHFILLGPVVKIDPAQLPTASNIHYLGSKSYAELPRYLAGWDAAIMPFALNDSTRFISPTKTPEYLAAGKRVVSTPIKDVVMGYGMPGLVEIAATASQFATALDRAISADHDAEWSQRVERKLAESSWDLTWAAMRAEIDAVRNRKSKDVAPISRLRSSHKFLSASGEPFDYLVVGAGFAGSVVAERLASQLGKRVLVIDKRPHIGGNTYDFYNEDGVLVHRYGPHIFHTSSQKVVDYLSYFTEWRPYEHRVLAQVDGKLLPIPINLDTINGLYGLNLDSAGMEKFLAGRAEPRTQIRTSEDIVVSRVGRELYEKFFRNYTRKQWGLDPSELDSCVAGRIPVRFDRDDRYFSDSFQAMPLEGFTRLFERMLVHPNINVVLSTDYREVMSSYPSAKVVYTGPIDEFFDYRFGPLPYRSLRFEHQTHDTELFQPAAVVNYPNDHDYTRITEFKHLTGQKHEKTSIVYEYPTDEGEPYYPIPRPENAALYERYRALASATAGVYFCGRLANYRYFNMDQVVAQALHMYRNIADDEAAEFSIQIPARMLGSATATAQAAT
jgi:UDP-galactopyranose mutase